MRCDRVVIGTTLMAESPRSAPEPAPFRRTAARSSASRPRLSLPGMRALNSVKAITSAIGARRTDNAVEPGTAVSAGTTAQSTRRGTGVDRYPDGDLCFRRPDGRLLPEVAEGAMVPQAPVDALRARTTQNGLHIHRATAMPGWLGERLDVGYAIDVLHPVAARVRTAVEFETPVTG